MPPVGVTATASTTLPGPVPVIAAGGAFLVFVGVTMAQANPVGAVVAQHWIEQGNARLAKGEATVQDLARPFSISQPAISRHLKVLEEAGLIGRARKSG